MSLSYLVSIHFEYKKVKRKCRELAGRGRWLKAADWLLREFVIIDGEPDLKSIVHLKSAPIKALFQRIMAALHSANFQCPFIKVEK